MLAAAAIGALWAFDAYEGYLDPYINAYIGMENTSLLIIVLLAFLVGFAVTSKRPEEDIQEFIGRPGRMFTGPKAHVRPSFDPHNTEEIEFVQDAYINYVEQRLNKLDENQPIVLKVKLPSPLKRDYHFMGRPIPLQSDIVYYYLEHLKGFPNFKYVVFVDWLNRFLFFSKAEEFRKAIETMGDTQMIDLVNANRMEVLKKMPIINDKAITNHATNMQALRFMAKHEIGEVMVVSSTRGRRVIGIIELTKLLGALMPGKKQPKKRKTKPSAQPIYDDGREDPVLTEDDKHHEPPEVTTDDRRREPVFSIDANNLSRQPFDDSEEPR